jgi:hypothetical protein
MKRSEMVKFITTELFYGSLSAKVDRTDGMITELAEKDAEAILKLVEKLGMLPPPDYTETYYSGDEPGGYSPNFWEDE